MMSSKGEKIFNEAISQMIQCDTNISFVSDQNKTIMLHYQKNGDKNTSEFELENKNFMVEIPFQYLVLDNTFESIINCPGDLELKDKLSLPMIMLIISRDPFVSSGNVRKLLPIVSKTPKQCQETKMNFFKEMMVNFDTKEPNDYDSSNSNPIAGSSSQMRSTSALSKTVSLVNDDFKIFHCPCELPYEDILSGSKNGDEYNPSVVLLCKKSELEKLNIIKSNEESNDDLVILKIYDIGWSQLHFDSKFERKYNYEELSFKEYYEKHIYKGLFLNELKIMKRIQNYNDNDKNKEKQINVPSLLNYGMITSYGYNGPFIIENYVHCIQNKPKTKESLELGVEQFNRLLGIGINHDDIAERNVGFDEDEQQFWVIDFDHSEMLPEGRRYVNPMTSERLKSDLEQIFF
ncbi:hypothetical protein BN7_1647 [Wickerhamomyces ciferrii]|uniref:Protein kinase domain-containing protein n=1 Tax=Wickerhamomyces ciferrii (strain ATCC 14091 / BCRC 22168 / CBS 111 / JCM 3599 / NBRC 0793 / NRRL Y-1031 F-60-10) TaxID=1206466 RepID=K0KAS8_WICCF|nr:uncharacterized protein BN7_1647 [Wickerhamomyces ciferrii]CCH42105.1 hypothetical protein BN7_1647 [Wickerhamomyces ciferrii]